MDLGVTIFLTDQSIGPVELAIELEARGWASLWVPEHTHIPTSRTTPYPNDPRSMLPEPYLHIHDPFTVLAMASTSTSTLRLCTGVCLILEHDLLDLACQTATLDVLSSGRLTLGIGVGWNREELANHRPDLPFHHRYRAMRERVQALRTAWADEEAEFQGEWDRYDRSWVYPKPANGTVPIALGNAGPLGIRHSAEYADEWCPIDASMLNDGTRPDVAGAIALFRSTLVEFGREPSEVPITIFVMDPNRQDRLETYVELGVDRLVLMPKPITMESPATTLQWLDDAQRLVERLGLLA
jgi:probable F420-dependent oxidoreductase